MLTVSQFASPAYCAGSVDSVANFVLIELTPSIVVVQGSSHVANWIVPHSFRLSRSNSILVSSCLPNLSIAIWGFFEPFWPKTEVKLRLLVRIVNIFFPFFPTRFLIPRFLFCYSTAPNYHILCVVTASGLVLVSQLNKLVSMNDMLLSYILQRV